MQTGPYIVNVTESQEFHVFVHLDGLGAKTFARLRQLETAAREGFNFISLG